MNNVDEEETPDADVQQAFTRGAPYSRTSRTDPQMEGDTVTTNIPPNVRDLNRQFENVVRALTHAASSYPTRNIVAAPKQTHVLLRRGRVGVVYEKKNKDIKDSLFDLTLLCTATVSS